MRLNRRMLALGAVTVALGITAAACGSSSKSSGGTTTAAGGATTTAAATGKCAAGTVAAVPIATLKADGKGKAIGLLFDVTGRGDKSFNDSAAAGLDKAKADFGVTGDESTPTAADGADRPERIKGMVSKDNLIVAVGFLWGDAVTASATTNPTQKYSIVDSVVADKAGTPLPNVRSMVFATNQSSFLVGAAAACASKTGKVGFIGGVENDLIKGFQAGFDAGAKAVNPKIEIQDKYITQPPDFTGFNDPAKGKAIAKAMFDGGLDVIYAAAGGSGKGLFEATKETGKKPGEVYAIGVDSDQYLTVSPDLQPYILTSALKRVDVATYGAIADQLNGTLKGEIQTFDLKNNGVGYSGSNAAINAYAGTIEKLKADIIAGTIVVPEKP